MSLRDWLAGQALTGIIAGMNGPVGDWPTCAVRAYIAADAMLEERER
jgi:hypothetical protein